MNCLLRRRERSKIYRSSSLPNQGGGELLLCLDVDCETGLEVDGEVIVEDGDLGDVPWDHRLVHDNVATIMQR